VLFWGPVSKLVRRYLTWFTVDTLVTLAAVGLAGVFWRFFVVLNVGWELDSSATPHRLDIRLVQDRPGLLYKVSKVMRDAKVNIVDIGLHRDLRTGSARILVDLEPLHIKTFRTVVSRLRNIKEVERISLVQANPSERRGLGRPAPR